MAGIFTKKKDAELAHHHPAVHQQLVAVSFGHVRRDVQNLYEWIRYLHDQNKAQQQLIDHLSRQIQSHSLKGSAQDEKALAHIQELRARIADMDRKVSTISTRFEAPKNEPSNEMLAKMSQIVERLETQKPQAQSTSSLQDKVIKKVQQNSKDYIKNVMRSMIQKYSKISGLQLREIVVDEQALCSRSSFYRLLTELEEDSQVHVQPNGKEKVYSPLQGISVEQVALR